VSNDNLREELKSMEIDLITPLDALNKLKELKDSAEED